MNDLVATLRHEPGRAMLVDWAGDTINVVDAVTGEAQRAYLFVAVLPFSGAVFCYASVNMKSEAWLDAHLRAFSFFGGVTQIIVPDYVPRNIIGHEPRDRAAKEREHLRMRAQPRILPHIQARLHERIPAERQTRNEQIHLRDLSRCRIDKLHRRPGPVDLDAAASLVADPGRGASDHRVIAVKPAEPVRTHRRLPRPTARVDILLVQQLQRHPDPGQLPVHLC